MKKVIFFALYLPMTLFIESCFLTSCSSSDEIEIDDWNIGADYTIIKPINAKDDQTAKNVNDFFNNYMCVEGQNIELNYDASISANEDRPLVIINNEEEYKRAITGDHPTLPSIDFEKYTLVFGCYFMSMDLCFDFSKMDIAVRDGFAILRCVQKCNPGMHLTGMWFYKFWNLYPKFYASQIDYDVIIKHD